MQALGQNKGTPKCNEPIPFTENRSFENCNGLRYSHSETSELEPEPTVHTENGDEREKENSHSESSVSENGDVDEEKLNGTSFINISPSERSSKYSLAPMTNVTPNYSDSLYDTAHSMGQDYAVEQEKGENVTFIRGDSTTTNILTNMWKIRPDRRLCTVPLASRLKFRTAICSVVCPDLYFSLHHYRHGELLGPPKSMAPISLDLLVEETEAHVLADPTITLHNDSKLHHKIHKILHGICSNPQMYTIRFLGYILGKLWKLLFSRLEIDAAGIGRAQRTMSTGVEQEIFATDSEKGIYKKLKKLAQRIILRQSAPKSNCLETNKKQTGTLLLPTHKSHIDYLLVSYICFGFDLPTPLIAAGNNLNIPIIGPLFRSAGAFFVRRTFSGDRLYSKTMYYYIRAVLKAKAVVEVFIQGGRSRTGLIGNPKLGFLKMAIDMILNDELEDVAILPASIDYERVLESASYAEMLMGKPKEPESLFQVIKSGFGLFNIKSHGAVYFNCSESKSLKQLIEKYSKGDANVTSRTLSTKIGFEVAQAQRNCSIVTPAALVSLVLLDGSNNEQMPDRVNWLIHILRKYASRKVAIPVSCTGIPISSLVSNALGAIAPFLNEYDGSIFYRANMTPQDAKRRLQLRYSCGELPSFLAPFATVAVALQYCTAGFGDTAAVPLSKVRNTTDFISKMLKHLYPGDWSNNMSLSFDKIIQCLVDSRCVELVENNEKICYCFDNSNRIRLLHSSVASFFETLSCTIQFLYSLCAPQDSTVDAHALINGTRAIVRNSIGSGKSRFPEALSSEDIQGCIEYCVESEILVQSCIGNHKVGKHRTKQYTLHPTYRTNLKELVKLKQRFDLLRLHDTPGLFRVGLINNTDEREISVATTKLAPLFNLWQSPHARKRSKEYNFEPKKRNHILI